MRGRGNYTMSLTPMDIQNKEFSRGLRGYKAEEVDEFMEQLSKDFEQAIKDKMALEEQKKQLDDKLSQYRKLEDTLHNAIIVAQETAEDVKRNANREAELIRREAEKDAQRVVEEARYRSSRILAEHEDVYKQAQIFKLRFRSFVEAQLASLELEDWLSVESDEDGHEEGDLG